MSAALSSDEDQASGNEAEDPSGNGRGSDNEDNRSEDAERQTGGHGEESDRESEDSSSDSDDDDTSDYSGSTSEAAQHLEEVYSRILKALHKTARIMCTGYERATGDVQGIIQRAVQHVTQPNKTFIQATNAHLSQWGQALHNMLDSEGASAEEREKANREARMAGLRCVRSLLAEGETFRKAEEQDTDQMLHDTVQAALRAANNRADKTNKDHEARPRHRPAIRSERSGGHLHYLSLQEHVPTLLVGARDGNVAGGGVVPRCPGDMQHKREHVPGDQPRGSWSLRSGC